MRVTPAEDIPVLDRNGLLNRRALLFLLGTALGLLGGFAVMVPLSVSVFIKPLSQALGWGRAEVSLLATMSFAGFTIAVPFTPAIMERIGVRRTMWIGYAALAGCLLMLGTAPATVGLFSMIAFLSGLLTAVTSPSGFMMLIGQAFDRRLGTAIGLAMIGFGLGAVGMPVFANHVLGLLGWQAAFIVMGLVTLALGSLSILLVGRNGIDFDNALQQARQKRSDMVAGSEITLRAVLSSWRFWIIGAAMLATSIAGFGAITHIPAALADRGMSLDQAALFASFIGIGLLAGRIASAMLMDIFHAPLVSMIFVALGGSGLEILQFTPVSSFGPIMLGVILAGLIVGTETDMGPVLARRYFPVEMFNRIYGVIAFLAGLGGMIGPFLFGYLRDMAGSYDLPFQLGFIICLAGGGAVLLLGRYRREP
ncbi:hypothetical protein ASE00_08895 [Sphingomonas sp. Root710]|uniref:MFS transporter n=1 Tax=Sphingomonas sp. Root710 TaxID=1736594 RepID=UPI0006FB20BF|nr:MFS transporter [Sphingomonas sp. Root710]KRB82205.1 hypothetical protein ASE00_08895 [Sphingomonas sp. Root710]